MKKLLIICLVFYYSQGAFAQKGEDSFFDDPNETETLFNQVKVVGAFGGPFFEYSEIGNDLEVSSGGGGGLIINDFFIGGYGMGSITASIFEEELESIELAHGGLWMGYTYRPYKLLHLFSSVKLGAGALDIEFDNGPDYDESIFVVTPELGIELNVFKFFKIGFTGGYRFVNGYDSPTPGFGKDELNGAVGTITLRFGGFGHGRLSRWR